MVFTVEAIQTEQPDSIFEWDLVKQVTDCIKKLYVAMDLDVYESIWFKLGMVIDTVVLCILI